MKKLILLAAAAFATTAAAQINSPDASGWIERAVDMYNDNNFNGCIDQLGRAGELPLTQSQTELTRFYMAAATMHTDKTAAAGMFRDFLADYPASPLRNRAMQLLGDCYYGNDYARALRCYEKVYDAALDDRQYEDLCYTMGYCCLNEGSLEDADLLFDSLKYSRRYSNAALFYRGYIAYAQGRYPEALAMLEQVRTDSEPGNMAPYYLSQIYFMRGDYQKSYTLATNLLRCGNVDRPFLAEAARIAGESAYQLGNESEAGRYLAYYVSLVEAPKPSALYILGLYAYNAADYPLAERYLRPVTNASPDAMVQSAYLYLGQTYLKLSRFDDAILAFNKSLNMDFDPVVKETAYYNYAVASVEGATVPFGSSVNTFTDFLRLYPNSRYAPAVQDYIITGYLTDNNYEAALASINNMSTPSEATLAAKQRVLYVLGTRALASGDNSKALEYLQAAAALASHNTQIATETDLSLGEALYRNRDYAEAAQRLESYLQAAPADAPNRALANYDLGYALFAQHDYAEAANAFAAMLRAPGSLSAPVIADAYNRLGDCRFAASDFTAAATAYDNAYNRNPANGDYALFQKALMEGYRRNYTEKLRALETLETRFPQSAMIPDVLLEKTECHIQNGNYRGAIAIYRELLERFPNTEQARKGYLQMALTQLNTGNRAAAIEAYKGVISRYPSSAEAALAVEQMKQIAAEDGNLGDFMSFLSNINGAPRLDENEVEALTFEAAERDYISNGTIARLEDFAANYPLSSSRPKALSYLVDAEYSGGNYQAAYEYATALTEQYPDSRHAGNAYLIKAGIEEQQGRGALALETWEQLSQCASTPEMLTAARLGIMRNGMLAEDEDQVMAAAEALLLTAPAGTDDNLAATFAKGWVLERRGNRNGAITLWETIADRTDNIDGIRAAFSIGQSYFDATDYSNAAHWAETVSRSNSPHKYWIARAYILMSDIYSARGENFRARQYLESLRENYPGTEADIFNMIDQRLN